MPALLLGHVALTAVAVLASLLLLGLGQGDVELPRVPARSTVVLLGVAVVAVVAHRHGPRPRTRAGSWWSVFGLATLAPSLWSVLLAGASTPALLAALLPAMALYLLVPLAGLVGLAAVVATVDLLVEVHRTRRDRSSG